MCIISRLQCISCYRLAAQWSVFRGWRSQVGRLHIRLSDGAIANNLGMVSGRINKRQPNTQSVLATDMYNENVVYLLQVYRAGHGFMIVMLIMNFSAQLWLITSSWSQNAVSEPVLERRGTWDSWPWRAYKAIGRIFIFIYLRQEPEQLPRCNVNHYKIHRWGHGNALKSRVSYPGLLLLILLEPSAQAQIRKSNHFTNWQSHRTHTYASKFTHVTKNVLLPFFIHWYYYTPR